MSEKVCKSCGEAVQDKWKTCPFCGAKLDAPSKRDQTKGLIGEVLEEFGFKRKAKSGDNGEGEADGSTFEI